MPIPLEARAGGGLKLIRAQHDQSQPVLGQDVLAPLIVSPALRASRNAADGRAPVHDRHGLEVLAFAIFDNQTQLGPVGIDWESDTPASASGVADQEIKTRLALGRAIEKLLA